MVKRIKLNKKETEKMQIDESINPMAIHGRWQMTHVTDEEIQEKLMTKISIQISTHLKEYLLTFFQRNTALAIKRGCPSYEDMIWFLIDVYESKKEVIKK
jgi:hypothetical protein